MLRRPPDTYGRATGDEEERHERYWGRGTLRHGDHRRWAGWPGDGLPPGQARAAVRDLGGQPCGLGTPGGSRDEMADYLEAYAARFELPVRTGVRVTRGQASGRSTPRSGARSGRRRADRSSGSGPPNIDAGGIERVARVAGVRDGLHELEDGRVLEVANVFWCTGFQHDTRGSTCPPSASTSRSTGPGSSTASRGCTSSACYFLYSMSSAMIHRVGRDADHIARHIATRPEAWSAMGAPAAAVSRAG
jgi:hypothetical protein